MTTETVILPASWASALINGDHSGLSDEEFLLLQEWFTQNVEMHFVDVGEPYFSHDMNDGSGLAGDVADYTVHIGEKWNVNPRLSNRSNNVTVSQA